MAYRKILWIFRLKLIAYGLKRQTAEKAED
jgi:hypothetical protein